MKRKDTDSGESREEAIQEAFERIKQVLQHTRHTPGNFSIEIKSTGETAYQRAIFMGKETQISNIKIAWVDLEYPTIASGASRDRCLDLLGYCEDKQCPVLCELKISDADGVHHPILALEQLMLYHTDLKASGRHSPFHLNANMTTPLRPDISYENAILIVAGSTNYWRRVSSDDMNKLEQITHLSSHRVIIFAIFPDENFSLQKSNNKNKDGKYRPFLQNGNTWKDVLETNAGMKSSA